MDVNSRNITSDQDPLDTPITVTIFPDQYAYTKAEQTLSVRKLARVIERKLASSKDRLPFLKGATFGDVRTDKNCLRHNANVLSITGVENDYDAEVVAPEEAAVMLKKAGIAALIYTTPSDGLKGRRWRVFCPLSKSHAPEERAALVAVVNGALGGIIADESFTLSQAFYYGGVGKPVTTYLVSGRYLDTATNIEPIGKRGGAGGTVIPFDEARLLKIVAAGESYYVEMMSLIGKWALDGVPLPEAQGRMLAAMDEVPEVNRDDRWKTRRAELPKKILDIYGKEWRKGPQDDPHADLDAAWESLGEVPEVVLSDEEMAGIHDMVWPREARQDNPRFALLCPDDCIVAEFAPYVVKGLISQGDTVSVVGAPGVGKSVLTPHLAYAVAQGREVFGMRTRQGGVFYIAAENERDMTKRVRALRERHGPAPDFHLVIGGGGAFGEKPFMSRLHKEIEAHRPALIVVDTLAASMPGFEENSSEGMGKAINAAKSLGRWGAAVCVVHHDTKAGDGLPRGHGSLNGIVDMNLALRREDKVIAGVPSKNRNGKSNVRLLGYSIETVMLGTDQDGDPITTVICGGEEGESDRLAPAKPSPSEAGVMMHFRELAVNGRIEEKRLKDACIEGRWVSQSEIRDSRKRTMNLALKGLMTKSILEFQDGVFSQVRNESEEFTDDMVRPDQSGKAGMGGNPP